jgi:hypothetical protein
MNKTVSLADILFALEIAPEDNAYLDTQTGTVIIVTHEDETYLETENLATLPQWMQEAATQAKLVNQDQSGRFLPLLTKFEMHEWEMLRDFAAQAGQHAQVLEEAIHARGAFARFKAAVRRLDLEQKWYEFRDKQYRNKVLAWCKDNDIVLVEVLPGNQGMGAPDRNTGQ